MPVTTRWLHQVTWPRKAGWNHHHATMVVLFPTDGWYMFDKFDISFEHDICHNVDIWYINWIQLISYDMIYVDICFLSADGWFLFNWWSFFLFDWLFLPIFVSLMVYGFKLPTVFWSDGLNKPIRPVSDSHPPIVWKRAAQFRLSSFRERPWLGRFFSGL